LNLYKHGPHRCADALLYKLRATREAIAVHLEDGGDLTTRAARFDKAADSLIGTYRNGIRYTELVADLSHVRAQR
jgi:sRNA-binding regulator protein Hfq